MKNAKCRVKRLRNPMQTRTFCIAHFSLCPWSWWAREEWASQAFQDGCPKWASSLSRAGMHLQGSQILDLWGLLIPSEPLARKWCSRPEGLPKPCDMGAPNGLARYRELQSHRQPQPSESCALIIELQERLAPSHHGAVPRHGASRRCCPGPVFLQRRPAGFCGEAKEMVGCHGTAPCSAV